MNNFTNCQKYESSHYCRKSCSTSSKNTCSELNWRKGAKKLNSVSLSNDTVRRRIHDMSDDISDEVTTAVRASKYGFAMQLDESTDVTNCGQLLVYVRFTENDIVKTELLMSKEVSDTTKGKDIFNIVDEFFKKNDLEWSKLVGCTTDGAPAMLRRKSGFQSYVKADSPEIIFTHCFIHRFALCAKVLPPELLSCLQQIVKIVNFVKIVRMFQIRSLCIHPLYLLEQEKKRKSLTSSLTRQLK